MVVIAPLLIAVVPVASVVTEASVVVAPRLVNVVVLALIVSAMTPRLSTRLTLTLSVAVPLTVSDPVGCRKVVVSKPGDPSASRICELLSPEAPLSSS